MEAYASIYQLYFYIMELNYKKKLLMSGMDNKEYTGLRFTAEEDNVQFTFSTSEKIRYWAPHSVWMKLVNGTNELKKFPSTPLKKGESVVICGDFVKATTSEFNGTFSSTGSFSVSGNIMSLIGEYNSPYQENFVAAEKSVDGLNYVFYQLFKDCTKLVDASGLEMPSKLESSCFRQMFYGCLQLTHAPTLPATTMSSYGYYEMFRNCSSLTSVPDFNIFSTNIYCFVRMFRNCSSLVTPPNIFDSSLVKVSTNCCQGMFMDCTELTSSPTLPAKTLANNCYNEMFEGCSKLKSSPILPATTLAASCYKEMFKGCSNLSEITIFASIVSASNCLTDWVDGVANNGSIKVTSQADWIHEIGYGASGVPKNSENKWTIIGEYNPFSIDNRGDQNLSFTFTPDKNLIVKYKIVATSELDSYINKDGYDYYDDFNGMQEWTYSTASPKISITELQPGKSAIFLGSLKSGVTKLSSAGVGSFSDFNNSYSYIDNNGNATQKARPVSVSGSILSLYYGASYNNYIDIPEESAFKYLLSGSDITDASNLILGFNLKPYCYQSMFENCYYLLNAPNLPSKKLRMYCYDHMFAECQSLKYPADIGAEEITEEVDDNGFNSCCSHMFYECYDMKMQSDYNLKIQKLAPYCYDHMFFECRNIKNLPIMRGRELSEYCYQNMFSGCAGLGGDIEWPYYSSGTVLAEGCCVGMFDGCYNLVTINFPFLSLLAKPHCFDSAFAGCSSFEHFTNSIDNTLLNIQYEGETILSFPPPFIVNSVAEGSHQNMFNGCSALKVSPVSFYGLNKLAPNCFNSMFCSCTSLKYGPFLPTEDLTLGSIDNKPTNSNANYQQGDYGCYENMFAGCESLLSLGIRKSELISGDITIIPVHTDPVVVLPAGKLASSCYKNMFGTANPNTNTTVYNKQCILIKEAIILSTTPETFNYNSRQYYAYDCYSKMFYGCHSLKNVKFADRYIQGGLLQGSSVIPSNTKNFMGGNEYYSWWMDGCKANGTFYKNEDTQLGYVAVDIHGYEGGVISTQLGDVGSSEGEYKDWTISTGFVFSSALEISEDGYKIGTEYTFSTLI